MRRPAKTEPFFDWGSLGWSGLEWWFGWRVLMLVAGLVAALVFALR